MPSHWESPVASADPLAATAWVSVPVVSNSPPEPGAVFRVRPKADRLDWVIRRVECQSAYDALISGPSSSRCHEAPLPL
jgi:hypothetical protein